MGDFETRYFSGSTLYGDDFDEPGMRRWYEQEEHGYYALTRSGGVYSYGYHALNELHAFRYLKGPYRCCLAMGCAAGDDVAPLAGRVERFVAIEPAEQWWSSRINGTAAEYMKPSVAGDIPLPRESTDLVVCFGVLHHIPNATHVFSEMVRTLRPGGHFVIREPISTMGDWRGPRRGLTANERGFPPNWLESQGANLGLTLVRKRYCCFPAVRRLTDVLEKAAYNSPVMVRIDSFLSGAFSWNLHYHRDTLLKKVAPGDEFCMFRK